MNNMENLETLTLGEIVKQNYHAAAVLEKFSLDFCCSGHRTIEQACREQNINPASVVDELKRLGVQRDSVNFDGWPLQMLIEYIVKRHHAYVEEKVPVIKGYLDKICAVHGNRHPELLEIRPIFFEVGGELAAHMKKEELLLFPFIKRLEVAKGSKGSVRSPLFKSVSSPVGMMKDDHAAEGAKLQRIASLTNGYKIPDDACNSFAVTWQLLEEFERDLHMHIHLENNILFPKAIALDEQVNGGNPS
jgi:regulator of cell morphogenesis and NO signaling